MEWGTILSASVVAAVVSSSMNFGFQLYFEKRKSNERNSLEIKENDRTIIKELYEPILIILEENIIPGDGYDGLDWDQLERIRKLIEINPFIVDSELDHITYSYLEDSVHNSRNQGNDHYYEKDFDIDRKLFYHVKSTYHTKKKNLNLPYNEEYIKIKVNT